LVPASPNGVTTLRTTIDVTAEWTKISFKLFIYGNFWKIKAIIFYCNIKIDSTLFKTSWHKKWFSNYKVSSVSTVSGYRLEDRAIEVRSPAEARDFSSSLCIQTESEAHPVSCTMGTGGPFPGTKARPGRDADHSPPSSAEVVNE
jgi:hypothetical protein